MESVPSYLFKLTFNSSNFSTLKVPPAKITLVNSTGFKVKECYSPFNEFAIRTVYAFVIEEYKHVSIDAILYICFDECEGEVVSVGLERITTLQEVKEKFLKYEEDLIFKIMAIKCYEDYKLEMFSDEKIVINIKTSEDVPF